MTAKRATILCPREPLGLRHDESAAFVGFSPSGFDRLVEAGLMPPPHQVGTALIWDADELAVAFKKLPRKKLDLPAGVVPPHGEDAPEDPWDRPPRA